MSVPTGTADDSHHMFELRERPDSAHHEPAPLKMLEAIGTSIALNGILKNLCFRFRSFCFTTYTF
jgi:hypothetical protein